MGFQQQQDSFRMDFILLSCLMTFLIQDLLIEKKLATTLSLISLLQKRHLNCFRWIWNAFLEKYIYICSIHSWSSMEIAIAAVHERQEQFHKQCKLMLWTLVRLNFLPNVSTFIIHRETALANTSPKKGVHLSAFCITSETITTTCMQTS